ncbi:NAD(P)/FAD-dependent oxidoreductase [Paenibacillus xerothermodurans]|uniref:NAD(P)/FAD-dependent oxidoreductase n=1 Tax=Paenibacillus xerothermodurans TaxID=1977292 RepID=A0A2W1NKH0_PAEXE|nr:FAD-dependent oxidoreductase [Paenibacillus xerothermodurans]PZE19553.1 NAD(P)/FAD-dependent oxidoreductase [Paenibacillus xerothermodurans]
MGKLWDAVVIGAGIAGSSLAKRLADRGWSTMLLDRDTFPRIKVCGEFLSPESQAMLEELGLYGTVRSLEPSTISTARLVARHGKIVDVPLPGIAWGISRYSLDAALLDSARRAGAELSTGTTVIGVRQAGMYYEVETRRGGQQELLQARTVFAAWGGRRRRGLLPDDLSQTDAPNRTPGKGRTTYVGIKCHLTGMRPVSAVELYVCAGGYVGLNSVENGVVNAAALFTKDSVHGLGSAVPVILEAAARSNPILAGRLTPAEPAEGTEAALAPVTLSDRPQPWQTIPHLGDAAVVVPPLCGDGMSMALRSVLLCEPLTDQYLRGRLSLQKWQQQYTAAVLAEFTGPLRWGRLTHALCFAPIAGRLAWAAARMAPGLASMLVRATRLRESSR